VSTDFVDLKRDFPPRRRSAEQVQERRSSSRRVPAIAVIRVSRRASLVELPDDGPVSRLDRASIA